MYSVSRVAKLVRARFEKGVLRLLEPVELEEGEEVLVRIERFKDREKLVEKYKGFMGEISEEELKRLIDEAELEKL